MLHPRSAERGGKERLEEQQNRERGVHEQGRRRESVLPRDLADGLISVFETACDDAGQVPSGQAQQHGGGATTGAVFRQRPAEVAPYQGPEQAFENGVEPSAESEGFAGWSSRRLAANATAHRTRPDALSGQAPGPAPSRVEGHEVCHPTGGRGGPIKKGSGHVQRLPADGGPRSSAYATGFAPRWGGRKPDGSMTTSKSSPIKDFQPIA